MSPPLTSLLAICLICVILPSQAIYFELTEGTEKCFIEEVPQDTLVVGFYRSPDQFNTPNGYHDVHETGILITVKEAETEEELMSHYTDQQGRFAFTSHHGGEHHICFGTNTSHWMSSDNRKFRVYLRIEVGEHAVDYDAIAKVEHLSAIEVEIRRLFDKLGDIAHEQAYQKDREETFRNTSESTNERVMWWSSIETAILLLSGFYQVYHLKKFFRSKKLV
eukprot:TRINITY_DN12759_c0_g1_i4.p1 TRINITY_DN12759_c0_g1~~TRINITY_DN12759_c0_g1_i4.p1  ORF type:complete len:221 (-),score=18.86 TRINITY_DN12759_c0_g1_i4:126-788(-)